jgi:hypothetical protein
LVNAFEGVSTKLKLSRHPQDECDQVGIGLSQCKSLKLAHSNLPSQPFIDLKRLKYLFGV